MSNSREVQLVARPRGEPLPSDFELVETPLPELGEMEVHVENRFMSVDPYMRPRMDDRPSYVAPYALGEVLDGGAVGEVIASTHPGYSAGDHVLSNLGWREAFVAHGSMLQEIDASLAPLSAYLGVLGMPGLTAYAGLLEFGRPKTGDVLFVSGAAGAVGNLVGQIAKRKGCQVIGSAGSDEKCLYLLENCAFDHAFNYKSEAVADALGRTAPGGLDIYFDNVGGDHLQAAFDRMRQYGRIVACGSIANYNATERPPGLQNTFNITTKELAITGFIVSSFLGMREAFIAEVAQWIADGEVVYRETIVEGIDQAPGALLGLFRGGNLGKMIVKL